MPTNVTDAVRPYRDDGRARRSHAACADIADETGGFQAFIPLAFHPDNNQMRKLPAPSGTDTLRVHAVARLMCDNIPHIKAFWIATESSWRRPSLWFGVDDLDGTVQEEKIYHMAGSATPEGMSTAQLSRLVRAAGREPLERDTLYNIVNIPAAEPVPLRPRNPSPRDL
jgi:aminodeoxyfutalosine synthase